MPSLSSDRLAAQLRVLLTLLVPSVVLLAMVPSAQMLTAGAALVVLATTVALVQTIRAAIAPRSIPPRAREPQTATFAPICRAIALPQDPIRPRAPGLV